MTLLLLLACAHQPPPGPPQAPMIQVNGAHAQPEWTNTDEGPPSLGFRLLVHNPNPFPITPDEVLWSLQLGPDQVTDLRSSPALSIPAKGSADIPVYAYVHAPVHGVFLGPLSLRGELLWRVGEEPGQEPTRSQQFAHEQAAVQPLELRWGGAHEDWWGGDGDHTPHVRTLVVDLEVHNASARPIALAALQATARWATEDGAPDEVELRGPSARVLEPGVTQTVELTRRLSDHAPAQALQIEGQLQWGAVGQPPIARPLSADLTLQRR